jgi:hypothetical protein
MNTHTFGMRTVVAAAAAGALVLGSAGVATAKGKPDTAPTPQSTVKLQSVSIKGHSPIDLQTVDLATAAINLRATVRDPKGVVKTGEGAATVAVSLAIFTRKTGDPKKFKVEGTDTILPAELTITDSSKGSKNKRYVGSATLNKVWNGKQLAIVDGLVNPGGTKYYACISDADIVGFEGEARSTKVKKRLSTVRDCVRIVDSGVDPVQPAQ